MASPFAALAGMARGQTARLSGEAAEFRPMARPNGPNGASVADTSRTITGFIGIFAEEPDEVFDTARVASFSPTVSAGSRVTVTFSLGTLSPRRGDRIARVGDDTVYSITESMPDGLGGMTCLLALVGT